MMIEPRSRTGSGGSPPHLALAVALVVALPTTSCGTQRTTRDRLTAASPTDTLRVLTYNIHIGRGTDNLLGLERIARVIAATEPHLVALQEVDSATRRTRRHR